jgi:hypothetical protein
MQIWQLLETLKQAHAARSWRAVSHVIAQLTTEMETQDAWLSTQEEERAGAAAEQLERKLEKLQPLWVAAA